MASMGLGISDLSLDDKEGLERCNSDEGNYSWDGEMQTGCRNCNGEGCENDISIEKDEDKSDDDYFPFDEDEMPTMGKSKSVKFDLGTWMTEKETELLALFTEQNDAWAKENIQQVVKEAGDRDVMFLQDRYEKMVEKLISIPEPVFKVTNMTDQRTLNHPLENDFNRAAAKFYHLQQNQNRRIVSIDIIQNTVLEQRFQQKKDEFRKLGIPCEPILAFHGSSMDSIQKIIKENFRLDCVRRTRYGFGIYFSEQPEVSMGYSGGNHSLLLCKILLGTPNIHSKEVNPDASSRCWAVVIGGSRDPSTMSQILPAYVINYN